MTKKKKGGEKFVSKYKVESATIYKDVGTFATLKIPGPDHVLYDPTAPTTFDPLRVAEIDAEGKMSTPIECWTDPDNGIMWVLDGRGRYLDVQEVNRRRKKDGRELVKPLLVPFSGSEREAIARVCIKNMHRRTVTPSQMAVYLVSLRKAGWSWADCCAKLHVETTDPEQYCRKLAPLAYCIPEVRAAIDAGDIPRNAVSRFGGGMPDGSKALGPKAQKDLLNEMLEERTEKREGKKDTQGPKPATPKARERLLHALSNGATENLKKPMEKMLAQSFAALLARLEGDTKAMKTLPSAVVEIVEEALKPLKRGRKPKDVDEDMDDGDVDVGAGIDADALEELEDVA